MQACKVKSGCAVLAGGAGKRMGNMNKAKLAYKDRSFVELISEELSKTGLPCYLSAANYELTVPDGWKLVRDTVTAENGEYIGPMGGICSCLIKAREDGLDGLFFVPCDAPLFKAEVISGLYEYIEPERDAVCWRTSDGRIQTTCGWYSVRCLDAFAEDICNGGYKLVRALKRVRFKEVPTDFCGIDERCFTNINCIDDYVRVLQ